MVKKVEESQKVQIYVKVDEIKKVVMDVSSKDEVQNILNTVSGSDWDVYATCEGRILRKDDEVKSCAVRDGSTVQVTSRMRGGGKHKDKRNKAGKKQATNPETEQKSDESSATMDKNEVLRQNEDEGCRKIIESVSEGSVGEVQQKVQSYLTEI